VGFGAVGTGAPRRPARSEKATAARTK
jgi:hypothetical protein